MDFHTFEDHVQTDPDNTDLEYITNIHSNTLKYMSVFECISAAGSRETLSSTMEGTEMKISFLGSLP
jgi:hypothetical protein